MQKHEYLDVNGWRYEWIDGALQTKNVPPARLKELGNAAPLAVHVHRIEQQRASK